MSAAPTTVSFSQSSPASLSPDVKKGNKAALLITTTTSLSSLPEFKDQRAYEHDRQRAKKASDRARNARRGRGPASDALPLSEKTRRLRADEVDALDGVHIDRRAAVSISPFRLSDQKMEVKLADLIVTATKPRKRSESDFEVVPHIRSVIVLDDIAPMRDLSIDEPWEHIDHSDSEDSDSSSSSDKALSYAKILSLSK